MKWHGGKHYLAKKIISLFPSRTEWLTYVEPYAGGLSVLLANDPTGKSEIVNDIDSRLTNFWQVLQNANTFSEFQRIVSVTPFSQEEFNRPYCGTNIEKAVRFFVKCCQSYGGQGRTFQPMAVCRTRRGINENASSWLSAVDKLPELHRRLRTVAVLNDDAYQVIRRLDSKTTLFYVDPPYLPSTRTSSEVYKHEMSQTQHELLLKLLSNIQGYFVLSGYPSDLYDKYGWHRTDFDAPNNSASGETKRRMVESVWRNKLL